MSESGSGSGSSGGNEGIVEEEMYTCRYCEGQTFTAAERDIHRSQHSRGEIPTPSRRGRKYAQNYPLEFVPCHKNINDRIGIQLLLTLHVLNLDRRRPGGGGSSVTLFNRIETTPPTRKDSSPSKKKAGGRPSKPASKKRGRKTKPHRKRVASEKNYDTSVT